MNYTIKLANCAFHARHGVLAEEEVLGQRFYVDATLVVDGGDAPRTDEIDGTVHYGEAYDLVATTFTGTRRNLIEAAAFDIATALLKRFSPILEVTVTVRKPSVPIAGILDHAEVTVSLDRSK